MDDHWDFAKFLEFAESHGWKLLKSCGQHRLFIQVKGEQKGENKDVERLFVMTVRDGRIDIEYVKRFKKLLGDSI